MDLLLATSSFLPSPGIASWGDHAGETAHAALGLAKGLRALGHRTTLVAPLDAQGSHASLGLARRLSPLTFDVGSTLHERTVHDARLPSGVEIVLLGGEPPHEGTTPEDIARRWAWFGHAVAALARQRLGTVAPRGSTEPELEAVVAIGEGASFCALAIREDAKTPTRDGGPSMRLLAGLARIVVPLHPTHDHRLGRSALASIGVPDELFSPEGIEFYGEASLVKSGAIAADKVVVLGDAPRTALLRPGAAHRFDGVFRARGEDVASIGSGIDQAQYNPATDPHVTTRFDAEDPSGKTRGKTSLLTELELDTTTAGPLLVVTGAIDASAMSTLGPALAHALRGELLVAVMRSGTKHDDALEASFEKLLRAHPGRFAIRHGVSEPILHRALAAADFSLAIDTVSATGTPVRAAMRYGTLPIALRTPAMEEAIVDIEASLATGTGFLVESTSESDLFGGIQRAVSAYASTSFRKLRRRAMRIEGGWERAARRLEAIIHQLEE